MGTELTTFEEQVKQKLKATVAEFIPEDRWNAIVAATINDFETKDLPKLIKDELTAQYKAAILEEFKKPEWQSRWNGVGNEASPAIKQLLIDSAPQILANILGVTAQNVLYEFQQRTRTY